MALLFKRRNPNDPPWSLNSMQNPSSVQSTVIPTQKVVTQEEIERNRRELEKRRLIETASQNNSQIGASVPKTQYERKRNDAFIESQADETNPQNVNYQGAYNARFAINPYATGSTAALQEDNLNESARGALMGAGAIGLGGKILGVAKQIAPIVSQGLNTSVAGIQGATPMNLINAGFAAEGLYNLPGSVKRMVDNPSAEGAFDIGMNTLFAAPIIPGIKSLIKPVSNITKPISELSLAKDAPISELFDLNSIKKPNGAIGEQGFTSEGVNNILKGIGVDVKASNANGIVSMKDMVTHLKNTPLDATKYQNFLKDNPIKITKLPDGSFHLADGNHRAAIQYFTGNEKIPAIITDPSANIVGEFSRKPTGAIDYIKSNVNSVLRKIEEGKVGFKYPNIREEIHGFRRAFLGTDSRPIAEKFPITTKQRLAAEEKQNIAFNDGTQFVDDWNYLWKDKGLLDFNVSRKAKKIFPGFSNKGTYPDDIDDILVSTKDKKTLNLRLSPDQVKYIRDRRGEIGGVSWGDKNVTLRNYGHYSINPDEIRDVAVHEGTHGIQAMGSFYGGWGRAFSGYDKNISNYYHANMNTAIGREFADAMVSPVKGSSVWEASPKELHSELAASRKIYTDWLSSSYPKREVMKRYLREPSDDVVDNLIVMKDLNRFFKPETTIETKRKLIRMLPSFVGTGVAGAATGTLYNNQR